MRTTVVSRRSEWRWKLAYCQSWRDRVRRPLGRECWSAQDVRDYIPVWFAWAGEWLLDTDVTDEGIEPDDAVYEDLCAI